MQRHLNAFWGGENIDEETGQHHLAAVMWHAVVLYEFTMDHPDFDDRSPNTLAWTMRQKLTRMWLEVGQQMADSRPDEGNTLPNQQGPVNSEHRE